LNGKAVLKKFSPSSSKTLWIKLKQIFCSILTSVYISNRFYDKKYCHFRKEMKFKNQFLFLNGGINIAWISFLKFSSFGIGRGVFSPGQEVVQLFVFQLEVLRWLGSLWVQNSGGCLLLILGTIVQDFWKIQTISW